MTQTPVMVEIWRGPILESQHMGHAVVCDMSGQIVEASADAELVMLPRSSAKMLQALPLFESGAAEAFGFSVPIWRLPLRPRMLQRFKRTGLGIGSKRYSFWTTPFALGHNSPPIKLRKRH